MSAVSSSPRRPSLFPRRAHDALFRRVHGNTLIYNTCWEDPRLDREMLGLDRHSRVVMITSAGCNALDYLLGKLSDAGVLAEEISRLRAAMSEASVPGGSQDGGPERPRKRSWAIWRAR